MKLALFALLCGACLVWTQEVKPKPELLAVDEAPKDPEMPEPFSEGEPFQLTESIDGTSQSENKDVTPKAEPEPTPEPTAEPTPQSQPITKDSPIAEPEPEPTAAEPTPEPEPAIKFDNIKSEDYEDAPEVVSTQPDQLNTEVIEELVDRFLNTGSIEKNQTGPRYANPAAHALINSSDYWHTDLLQEPASIKDEERLSKWISGYETEAIKVLREVAVSGWRYFNNASPGAKAALDEAEEVLSLFVRATSMQAKQFDQAAIKDEDLKRKLGYVGFEGISALSADKAAAFSAAQSALNRDSKDSSICDKDVPPPCALQKIDLDSIFRNEKDASRLSHLWVSYVSAIAKAKGPYNTMITLTNEGAKLNGFSDGGAMWRSAFDLSSANSKPVINLKDQVEKIYQTVQPFYQLIHAYVRRQLAGIYSKAAGLSKDGPIPAHLFGSLEGGDWSAHFEQTKPFDEESDLPETLLASFNKANYTTKNMFIDAYRYMKSVGFPSLPKSYWTQSIFSRIWSRDMICNPSAALDMRAPDDFRVKVCAQLGEPDFELAHSLLAQTYYQYLYKDQSLLFREGASPVITDAISAAFAHLSTNPHYLYSQVGNFRVLCSRDFQKLVPASYLEVRDPVIINKLYKEALESFTKLPYAVAADNWRYELFEGKVKPTDQNDRWWSIRTKYEGVRAPQPYNTSNLDALIHNSILQEQNPATKQLISYVLKFQILKALCPEGTILSEGCILSEDTTEKLREAMKLGSSVTWTKALEIITGKGELDAAPLLDYYEPLINWLRNTNEIDQVVIGWDGEGTPFSPEEIPKPRSSDDSGNGFPSEDRVAFPGGDCANGQECLLDSHCNGTTCVCNEGLFTLEIGNTFNCVPGNPADSGFGDGKGGLVIGLFQSETTPEPEPTSTTTSRPKMRVQSSAPALFSFLSVLLAVLAF